jgi:phosphoribosylaminoimidazole-succinocarboxamide synthase
MTGTDNNTLVSTHFFFKDQEGFMRGKVRDVYTIGENHVALVASDRISAFDHVLPAAIPYKGQVLNQIASKFLEDTKYILPNWKIAEVDPHATVGYKCKPYAVEFVVRGYLAGHAWREYKAGKREICGVSMPDGLKENDKLPTPILTPSTKAESGHDVDISVADILQQKIINKKEMAKLEEYSLALFAHGTAHAEKQGLILVDTKYEFGKRDNTIILIDEIHTPDSSRYFYANTYNQIQAKDQQQKQLSKEFVRQWLITEGFQGEEGQVIPEMDSELVNAISERYIELYESITGDTFIKRKYTNINEQIEMSVNSCIANL